MTSTDEATYLGASITQTITRKDKIRKNISATMADFKKLDIFLFFGSKSQYLQHKIETVSVQCGYKATESARSQRNVSPT